MIWLVISSVASERGGCYRRQKNGLVSDGQGGGAVHFAPHVPTAELIVTDCHFINNHAVNVLTGQWRHFAGTSPGEAGEWQWVVG
eukprot:962492-Prorocentrum_minimum.AAC.1